MISTEQSNNTLEGITFSADNKKLAEVLAFIKKDMARYHLSEKSQFNMVTAAEEIFSNIAMYAYSSNKKAIVTINTNLKDNVYAISFKDNGKKYNPLENNDPDITADIKDKNIGGLGIFLVKKLTDIQTYVYKNNQNILTIGIYTNN